MSVDTWIMIGVVAIAICLIVYVLCTLGEPTDPGVEFQLVQEQNRERMEKKKMKKERRKNHGNQTG